MALVFAQRETTITLGNYVFNIKEPKTSDLTSITKDKDESELGRSIKVLQKNLTYRLVSEPSAKFQAATLEEVKDLPSGVIRKISDALDEMTDGEFAIL